VADGSTDMVVVVDNDPGVRDSAVFLLESAGYRATAFSSAAAFLADRVVRPACLIVDHDMPEMTGLRLAERLRREGVALPILLIAEAPKSTLLLDAAQCGIYAVLMKPPDPDDLLKFVEACLGPGGR
jgi:FixJ family two-component response regulator